MTDPIFANDFIVILPLCVSSPNFICFPLTIPFICFFATLSTRLIIFRSNKVQQVDKQARKPRSYASPKLFPTHSLADRGQVKSY